MSASEDEDFEVSINRAKDYMKRAEPTFFEALQKIQEKPIEDGVLCGPVKEKEYK